MKRLFCPILVLLLLAACSPKARDAVACGERPDIYPDYVGVTVPVTIAPLDFTLKGADAIDVLLSAPDGGLHLYEREGTWSGPSAAYTESAYGADADGRIAAQIPVLCHSESSSLNLPSFLTMQLSFLPSTLLYH